MKLWPGNPAESRARLQALVDRELPRLRALEETLRVQYEDPERAAAEDLALANVTPEELSLLRAERIHEQSYHQAVTALRKAWPSRRGAGSVVRAASAAQRELVEGTGIVHRGAGRVVRGAWGGTRISRPSARIRPPPGARC